MSFSLTTDQVRNKTKTVTRRLGWDFLKEGDFVWAVEKGMGLKKGEKVKRIGLLEIVSVSQEFIHDINKGDCIKEGFPDMGPKEFVAFFCEKNKCSENKVVTRIEFKYHPLSDYLINKSTKEVNSYIKRCKAINEYALDDLPF